MTTLVLRDPSPTNVGLATKAAQRLGARLVSVEGDRLEVVPAGDSGLAAAVARAEAAEQRAQQELTAALAQWADVAPPPEPEPPAPPPEPEPAVPLEDGRVLLCPTHSALVRTTAVQWCGDCRAIEAAQITELKESS